MPDPRDPRLLVVALGGAALRGLRGRPGGRADALETAVLPLVELLAAGFRLVLTHGHTPHLDDRLARAKLMPRGLTPEPINGVMAELQGAIGHAIQQALDKKGRERGLEVAVVPVVTRVVVDAKDPAFERPTLPVGPAYAPTRARQLMRQFGWTFAADRRRSGARRLLAAPRPLRVVGADLVGHLVQAGAVPVAGGGGGIAVVETDGALRGVEAVVEPDATSEMLATALGADRLVFLTGVACIQAGFRTPRAIGIERLTRADAEALLVAREFPPATIGAKVEAGLRFVEAGGREALVTSPDHLRAALDGDGGTRIVR